MKTLERDRSIRCTNSRRVCGGLHQGENTQQTDLRKEWCKCQEKESERSESDRCREINNREVSLYGITYENNV